MRYLTFLAKYSLILIPMQLFGFIVTAHETTAITITWTLKMLTDYQDVQEKLRLTLNSSFSTPKSENRPPTHQEIVKLVIPYLDALIKEAICYSRTSTIVIRTTTTDVQVLGTTIPKDTQVFLLSQGPSIFNSAFRTPDSLRSKSALAPKDRIGSWDPEDIGEFNPERWLKEENGKLVFDAASGPMLTFGLGARDCLGGGWPI
jgi:cytochrome P450